MNILLIQRDGVDLHHTLFASETSPDDTAFLSPEEKTLRGIYNRIYARECSVAYIRTPLVYPSVCEGGLF